MAFNPNLPADHGPLSSADMRNQLNALKALIDAQAAQITTQSGQIGAQQSQIATLTQQMGSVPTMDQVNAAITANSAGSVANADTFGEQVSDPPTQAEVQLIVEYLTYLVGVMKR